MASRVSAGTNIFWFLGTACLPSPSGDSGTTTSDSGATTGGLTGSSGATTGDPPATTGDPPATTGDSPATMGDSDDSGTPCEPTGEPVCSAIPVPPGGESGCGGEELSISGCDQLAGYELCPDESIHRHTAGIPCDDVGLCDPLYTCHTDDDCGPDRACVCDVTWGDDHPYPGPFTRIASCVYATCQTDADCAFGMRCGVDTQCGYVTGLFCHTPEDGCEGDADCPEHCGYSHPGKRWFCVGDTFCE